MQKYINMNESFGGKECLSSTNSFQTSYQECIQSLKQQMDNHKKALQMAEKLVEQYKNQNQLLSSQIQMLKQSKIRTQQKYEILEGLFVRLNKTKEKQIYKQSKRQKQKHLAQMDQIHTKYLTHIDKLTQKIVRLEIQLKSSLDSNIQHSQSALSKHYGKNISKDKVTVRESMSRNRQVTYNSNRLQQAEQNLEQFEGYDLNDHIHGSAAKSRAKLATEYNTLFPQCEFWYQTPKQIPRCSLGKKQSLKNSKHKQIELKGDSIERKTAKSGQGRFNTVEDYFSIKLHNSKTSQKPKNSLLYGNKPTHYRLLF